MADSLLGYSITSSPLVVKDKVIVGVSGGEFGARGFLDAYDAVTGKARGAGIPFQVRASSGTTPGPETVGRPARVRPG